MKYFITIILCMAAVLSCRTKRTVVQQTERRSDTLNRVQTAVQTSDHGIFSRIIRDTVLSVQERTVTDTIENCPLSEGDIKVIQGKGVNVKLTALSNGRIAVKGTCDSLSMLLQGQIEETRYWQHKYELSDSTQQAASVSELTTAKDTKTQSSFSLWTFIALGVLCFGGGLLVGIKVF